MNRARRPHTFGGSTHEGTRKTLPSTQSLIRPQALSRPRRLRFVHCCSLSARSCGKGWLSSGREETTLSNLYAGALQARWLSRFRSATSSARWLGRRPRRRLLTTRASQTANTCRRTAVLCNSCLDSIASGQPATDRIKSQLVIPLMCVAHTPADADVYTRYSCRRGMHFHLTVQLV